MSKFKIQMTNNRARNTNLSERKFGKGALSANDIFSTTTPWGPEQLQAQFWAEDGVIAGIVEKIWLSGDERLFRRSGVTSRALKRMDKGFSHKNIF